MRNSHHNDKTQAPPAKSQSLARFATNPRLLAGAAFIVLVTILAYLPCVCGEFVMDDDLFVGESHLILPSGLNNIWCSAEYAEFYPVSYSAFWIEWRLWGMNPAGYHVFSLILHIVEALLFWAVLRKLAIPGAFLAALLFAVHPVNVESVAWIAQGRNMTAMLFLLLSVLWYLKSEATTASMPTPTARPSSLIPHPSSFRRWYWLSLTAFLLAMLCKGSATMLPVLLLGITWWRRRLASRDFLRLAPFLLLATILTAVNIWFETHGEHIEIRHAGLVQRLQEAGGVIWFYLYKALWPVDLAFIYPQWTTKMVGFQSWLPLLAVIAVTVALWSFRNRFSRLLLFAWGFYCISLLPVMGFTDVGFMKYSLVADHYQHIAIVGAIALVAAGWSMWHRQTRRESRWLTNSIAAVVLGTLALLTWRQSGLYGSPVDLYQATLQKNPGCWAARYNLGNALGQKGHWQDAIKSYAEALRLKPDYAEALNNLGNAFAQAGRLNEAIDTYEKVLRLQPDYADAYLNLGVALSNAGHLQEAIERYHQALKLNQDSSATHNNLGAALDQMGMHKEAIEHYEMALHLNPDNAEVHDNLGRTLVKEDRLEESVEHYERAIQLKRDYVNAYNDLGIALSKLGRQQEAVENYRQALFLRPDFTAAYCNLAMAYARMQRPADAIDAAQKGLGLARSQRQSQQAKQIEDWLNAYRANLSNRPNN
jgi:protein O-mannosyl-transferase